MLRWIILAVVVIALTAGATFLAQYAPNSDAGPSTTLAVNVAKGPQPKVEIAETLVHDFGSMAQQDKGTHAWEIKNVGEANLELWMLSQTCSCTIAKLKSAKGEPQKKVVVEPNKSTTIDLEWETRNNQNEYKKGATIGTNDPTRRSFDLTVKGKVFPAVMVYPPEMIQLPGMSNEEVTRTSIGVFSFSRPETKIKKISSSRPDFIIAKDRPMEELERKPLHLTAGGRRVDVEIKPGLPLGRFKEELVIETDHPRMPEVKVTIAGNTTGPISVVPERFRMMSVSSSDGKIQSLTILVRGGRETKFEVVHKPANIVVTITPNETATQKGRYLLTVTVPPGTPAGLIDNDEIVIRTDHPRATELKIPVTILISNVGAG